MHLVIFNYRMVRKFGGNNDWRKWVDEDFGEKKLANE